MPKIAYVPIASVYHSTDSIRIAAVQVLRIFSTGPRLISPEDAAAIGAHLASIVTYTDSLNSSCRRPVRFDPDAKR